MCMACGQMFMNIHWSDTLKTDSNGFVDQSTLLRNRLAKVKYTNQILGFYGLKVNSRAGGGYSVSTRTGRSVLCSDFGDLWPKAQMLTGKTVDPLDPALLTFLREGSEEGSEA